MNSITKLNSIFSSDQKIKFYLLFFIIFFVSFLDFIGIGIILPILIVFSEPLFLENEYIIFIIKRLNFLNKDNFLNYLLIFLLIVFILKTLLSLTLNYVKYRILLSFHAEITNKLMKIYLNLSYSEFIRFKIFEKSNTLKTEVENFILGVVDPILIISLEILTISLISIFLIYYDPSLLIKIVLFGSLTVVSLTYLFGKRLKKMGSKKFLLNNLLQQQIFQGLQGIKDIKLSLKEKLFLEKFSMITKKMTLVASSIKSIQEAPRLIIELLAVICFVFIILISMSEEGRDFSNLIVTLGIFAASAFRILPSLNRIVVSTNSIKQSHSVISSIYNDFQLEKKINNYEHEKNDNRKIQKIEINNLNYRYHETSNLILNDLNLEINYGDYLGIYGKSGSGKSTFVDVFSGLLIPESGDILFNGKDINSESNQYLWKNKIGYVPQSIYLNNETFKENIAFGEDLKNINEEKILDILKKTSLETFINKMPLGINSIIGENGVNLSGGQIQRLGIARALYRDPEILIFDESTNSLDADTESEFMKVVNKLKSEKIIIFISHKTKILKECNKIYEFNDGKLILKK